jgi:hypothetical protein
MPSIETSADRTQQIMRYCGIVGAIHPLFALHAYLFFA